LLVQDGGHADLEVNHGLRHRGPPGGIWVVDMEMRLTGDTLSNRDPRFAGDRPGAQWSVVAENGWTQLEILWHRASPAMALRGYACNPLPRTAETPASRSGPSIFD
jgi:hypothetical protein